MQVTRWKGQQSGDIVIPFGGVGGELKGLINCNQRGDIWVSELEALQLGNLISQLQVHQGELNKAWTTPITMRMGHMLVQKDQQDVDEMLSDGSVSGEVHYQLPPQFFVPENQENRVFWAKVFKGAEHVLVKMFSFIDRLGIYTQNMMQGVSNVCRGPYQTNSGFLTGGCNRWDHFSKVRIMVRTRIPSPSTSLLQSKPWPTLQITRTTASKQQEVVMPTQ